MTNPKTPTPDDIAIGKRIATIRSARHSSQTAMGRAIGVSFQQVQKYEAGKNRIGAARLVEIARFLGVKVKDLYPDGDGREPKLPTSEELYLDYLRAKAAYKSAVKRELEEVV